MYAYVSTHPQAHFIWVGYQVRLGNGHYLRQGGQWNSENRLHSQRAPFHNRELRFCPPPPNLCTQIEIPPPLLLLALKFYVPPPFPPPHAVNNDHSP